MYCLDFIAFGGRQEPEISALVIDKAIKSEKNWKVKAKVISMVVGRLKVVTPKLEKPIPTDFRNRIRRF